MEVIMVPADMMFWDAPKDQNGQHPPAGSEKKQTTAEVGHDRRGAGAENEGGMKGARKNQGSREGQGAAKA